MDYRDRQLVLNVLASFCLSVNLLEDEDLVRRIDGRVAQTSDDGPQDDLQPKKRVSELFDVRRRDSSDVR